MKVNVLGTLSDIDLVKIISIPELEYSRKSRAYEELLKGTKRYAILVSTETNLIRTYLEPILVSGEIISLTLSNESENTVQTGKIFYWENKNDLMYFIESGEMWGLLADSERQQILSVYIVTKCRTSVHSFDSVDKVSQYIITDNDLSNVYQNGILIPRDCLEDYYLTDRIFNREDKGIPNKCLLMDLIERNRKMVLMLRI